jgi:hypothetical protein
VRDLQRLDYSDLMDLLSEQTAIYMKILRKGGTKDQLAVCREFITEIQIEIEARKDKPRTNQPIPNPTDSIPIDTSLLGLETSPN